MCQHICKKFPDDINEMMKELDLEHIFVHADEQVYARLAHTLLHEINATIILTRRKLRRSEIKANYQLCLLRVS